MRQPEITSRIHRDHLQELLETEAPVREQRITARMPAVTLTGLLTLREEDLPPLPPPARLPKATRRTIDTLEVPPLAPIIVSFRAPVIPRWPLDAWPRPFVIAISASITIVVARLISLL